MYKNVWEQQNTTSYVVLICIWQKLDAIVTENLHLWGKTLTITILTE